MSLSRSLMPSLLGGRNWWDWDFPSRIGDQHYGMGLTHDDLLAPTRYHGYYVRPRRQLSNRGSTGLSEVKNDANKFQICMDVSHFAPNEIEVKTVDNCVLVRGKHEEKADEHGFVSREFSRRYVLPTEVLPESVTSSLTQEGILVVEAPKKGHDAPKADERLVPIQLREAPLDHQPVAAEN